MQWIPPFWHLVEILEILLLHALSNDACRFTINHFPISWEPFENVNLFYLVLLMQIWNGCNAFNIAGNPIKDINAKLTFLTSASKIIEWTPLSNSLWGIHIRPHHHFSARLHRGKMFIACGYAMDPPILTSGGNLGNSTFACTLQWCMQIYHKPFPHQLRAIWKC